MGLFDAIFGGGQSATSSQPKRERATRETPVLGPLEDFALCLPKVSGHMEITLDMLNRKGVSFTEVFDGVWVRKGQIIATCVGIPLLAPVDGQVVEVPYSSNCPGITDNSWPELPPYTDEAKRLVDRCTLCKIRPLKGSNISGYIYNSYHLLFDRLDQWGSNDRKVLGWSMSKSEVADREAKVMAELHRLRTARSRTEPWASR